MEYSKQNSKQAMQAIKHLFTMLHDTMTEKFLNY